MRLATLVTEIHVEVKRIVAIRPRLAPAPYFRDSFELGGVESGRRETPAQVPRLKIVFR